MNNKVIMKRYSAFTLIELLVVVAIIALLVSILMPALNTARQQATGAVCLANQKTMGLAWVMYHEENDGRIVDGNYWAYYPGNALGIEAKYDSIRRGTLYPYIETVEAYHCPGDKRSTREALEPPAPGVLGGYRSYSLPGGLFGVAYLAGGWGVIPHLKVTTIERPSEKYVFLEEMDSRGGNMGAWVLKPAALGDPPEGAWYDPMAIWHNDAGTLGFCDGHAELRRWVDQSTYDMCERQTIGTQNIVYDFDSGDDLELMQRGYAYKRLTDWISP